MKNKHKIVSLVAGAIALGSVVTPALAQTQAPSSVVGNTKTGASTGKEKMFTRGEMVARASKGVSGTVVSVSGNTITLTDRKNTMYTVDTTNAKFSGGLDETFSIANILPGDKIRINGTVTGTTVAATSVMDASYMARTVFSGKVTAVSGMTITMMKNKNVTLTVDTSSATFKKGFGKNAKTIAASDIAVGDRLTVVGTISGENVTAASVEDAGSSTSRASMFTGKKGLGAGVKK